MIAIVLLAAGRSSRMGGRDKLLEIVDGMPLLRRQAMRALGSGAPVFVTLPLEPHPRYTALEGLALTQVPVPDTDEGMNASLRTGISALPQGTHAAMVLLADMPDLTEMDLETVLQAVDLKSDKRIWRATTAGGAAGHPVVFHAKLFDRLIALEGDAGGASVVKSYPSQTVEIPLPADHARTDLDTPEAWDLWRKNQASS